MRSLDRIPGGGPVGGFGACHLANPRQCLDIATGEVPQGHDGRTTSTRSPPSTCTDPVIARRSTVPATALVMLASIFIASMVATTPPASTPSPSPTVGVT